MTHPGFVVGVDGGGTKTIGELADHRGTPVATHDVGPTNPNVVGIEESARTLCDLLRHLVVQASCSLNSLQGIVLGLAGGGADQVQKEIREKVQRCLYGEGARGSPIQVVTDVRIALEGAFGGAPGIALVAGTGSSVMYKTTQGDVGLTGGWGRILGDEGSGYFIGLEALKAVTRDYDGVAPSGALRDALAARFDLGSRYQIIEAVYRRQFSVASLAPLVFELACPGGRCQSRDPEACGWSPRESGRGGPITHGRGPHRSCPYRRIGRARHAIQKYSHFGIVRSFSACPDPVKALFACARGGHDGSVPTTGGARSVIDMLLRFAIFLPILFSFFTCTSYQPGTSPGPLSQAKVLHGSAQMPPAVTMVDSLIARAIADSAFPGAQLAILRDSTILVERAYGRHTYDLEAQAVDLSTLFDLASLTKVIATTAAVMKLYDEGRLSLDDPVMKYLPRFTGAAKKIVSLRHLLLHRSGLPAFRRLSDIAATEEAALDSVFSTPLVAEPGDSTIYSDLGMITLGKVVEQVTGMSLARYVQEEFYAPMGMAHTMFNPPLELRSAAAPTEYDSVWRKTLVQGAVHDENAATLSGVAGHAGLFSTASDLARFMQMLLNGGRYHGKQYLRASTIDEFLRKRSPGQERWLGWDMKAKNGSSAGSLFSASSFGHTGFTGTSIWADPDSRLAVIFLTNRIYPSRANSGLNKIRPLLHDAIVRAMEVPKL